MRKGNILKEAVVLLFAAVIVFSTASAMVNTEKTAVLGRAVLFEDDFESYTDFVLDFPPWTQFDGDGAATYGFTSYVFPNE